MPVRAVKKVLLASILGLCVACSGSGGLNTVTGQVNHNGTPIKGAIVVFHPKDADMQAQRPSGVTNDEGKYTLTTGVKQGAPPGEYVVTIIWPEDVSAQGKGKKISTDSSMPDQPDRLKGRYADSSRSQLSASVKRGKNEIPTFELQ